jgi:hypothetical protein
MTKEVSQICCLYRQVCEGRDTNRACFSDTKTVNCLSPPPPPPPLLPLSLSESWLPLRPFVGVPGQVNNNNISKRREMKSKTRRTIISFDLESLGGSAFISEKVMSFIRDDIKSYRVEELHWGKKVNERTYLIAVPLLRPSKSRRFQVRGDHYSRGRTS